MKAFKFQLNHGVAIMAMSSTLFLTNAIGQIPYDSNLNGYWDTTNGINLKYITPASGYTYYGINGNGVNDVYSSIGENGVVIENTNHSPVDIAWAALDTNGGSFMMNARLETRQAYIRTDSSKELQFGWTTNYVGGFGYQPNFFLGDSYSTCTTGFSIGGGMSPSTPPIDGLSVSGAVSTDGGLIVSDGSGDLTVVTLHQTSDRTMKENIKPIPEGKLLKMALALPDFSWNFKAQASAAADTQFGPMAQDWHAVTGLDDGHHISVTAMQGMLLGAVQDLANQLPSPGTVTSSTDSTSGCGAGLIKWDGNYIYISVGTNQWKRAALATW